jgi:hypothetical protein
LVEQQKRNAEDDGIRKVSDDVVDLDALGIESI